MPRKMLFQPPDAGASPRLSSSMGLLTTLLVVSAGCDDRFAPSVIDPTAPSLSLKGPRVVRYNPRRPVVDRILINGRRDDEGQCGFRHSVRLRKGQAVQESVLEYDPDTCQFIIARHPVDASSLSRDLGGGSRAAAAQTSETDYETYRDTIETQNGAGPAAMTQCPEQIGSQGGANQVLWHEDPFQINVAKSTQETFFFYNNQCVQYARSWLESRWFRFSGWFLEHHLHYLQPMDAEWTHVRGTGFQRMANNAFCPDDATTYAHYWPNEIRMWYDGYVAFDWVYAHWGGCAGLLHANRLAGAW